ncbi:cysteine-rich receptor-like protein kinase 15 [Cryptomeria japonica]|uniref:cysteine-rich receptor-like protein kinase 15 n=1 Tax=Cryptomeria japonica TaxID=3369 RepID=UPI0027DA7652|nr:cysteine-rich receptor-like protein kinase 15 [Cryptomeria japonica]
MLSLNLVILPIRSIWVAEDSGDLSYKKSKMSSSSCFYILLLFLTNFSSLRSDYRWYKCNNDSTFTDGSTYSTNLIRVMSDLFRNASLSSRINTSSFGQTPNKVYGLLQCFGNLSADKCSECAQQANSPLKELCANDIGRWVLMDDCFLRYDNSSFISTLYDSVFVLLHNVNSFSGNMDDFKATTSSLLSNLSNLSYDPANRRFAMGSANYSTSKAVYGLVQCWRDLSINDCKNCLFKARSSVENCCSKNQGGRALLGSCVVRFESYSFFDTTEVSSPEASPPTPTTSAPPTAGQAQSKKKHSKLPIILGVVGGLIMLLVICLIAKRKRVKSVIFGSPVNLDTRNEERHGYSTESALLIQEHQHFIMSLEALAEATHNFHDNNKLGEGGFGSVYRGTNRDGKEIAVKKLSARSSQGTKEFMNEVKLMANVQHRNLVKLLGCCAEGDERLLVYEYFANKSLDTFLFHPTKHRKLDWQKRYNIITGIARGLLYLHEDSQLKIIHRDIKANNILLDDKLNLKIADFGLARLFPEDETQIQTRVAGTYGYMAPEYAMRGQLSVKADVYSFGVLLLEIVSGRKNTDFNLPQDIQNLLEWAWRLCRGGDVISMVESTIKESCPQERVRRCIHVALLCVQAEATVRPAMSNVIIMLSSNSVTLPNPTKPASVFLSGSESSAGLGYEKDRASASHTSGTIASSASGIQSGNDTSISDVEPR